MNRTTREIISQSQAETNAINYHLATLEDLNFINTIRVFDGKVINKRFFDAMKVASGKHIIQNYGYSNEMRMRMIYNEAGKGLPYAQWYRECTIPLAFQECGKRLDASATIENIETEADRIHGKLNSFKVSEGRIGQAHADIEALKDKISEVIAAQSNPFLTESLRQALKYIR